MNFLKDLLRIVLSLFSVLLFGKSDDALRERLIKQFDPADSSSQIVTFKQIFPKRTCLIQAPFHWEEGEKYPLVIALHGSSKSDHAYFVPVIAGNREDQEGYPCFYVAPNNKMAGWDEGARWVRSVVHSMTEIYPIDPERIYLIGFSMGGSGSFPFAEALYDEYGIVTAGIVRCAGMSRPILEEPLWGRTAVWYHVGLDDSDLIRETARRFYGDSQENLPLTGETEEKLSRGSLIQTTHTLFQGEREFVKYSTYQGMGHEFSPVFEDRAVLDWLFAQSL
ncbi:MAG: alpha/beta hydrolase [Spirochaetales bacterium]|nr:alpha/beta hydrolase [Spirochaetales bacterium]